MPSACLLILQQAPTVVCLLFIKKGKSRLWELRYFHFRWLLSFACLCENSKWKHLVTRKCLRLWCILENDSSWPRLYWTLVQLEPSEHLNPRCKDGIGGAVKACPPQPFCRQRTQRRWQIFPVPEQFNKKRTVSLLQASVLFQVLYLWSCQKEKLCLFEVCVQEGYLFTVSKQKRNNLRVGHSLLAAQSHFSLTGRIPLVREEIKLALLNSCLLTFDSYRIEIF